MRPVLLADIGSTYTKVIVVDLDQPAVLCRSFGLTTADQDISIGFDCAFAEVEEQVGIRLSDFPERLACSSAAGGLQMVAIGLVPELTAKAARLASLGAGARVIRTYSYQLNQRDLSEIESLPCDILLLAGGTDGGERATIIENAKKLAGSPILAPIVVAGNRDAADEAESLLCAAGKDVYVADNVLPSLKRLNIDPARQAIRSVFMEKIVQGKGFEKVQDLFGTILMPTPAAVLEAAKLLAEGLPGTQGLGDLLVVDIGGATTDIHSIAEGTPSTPNAVQRGLPEPRVKRTVEGDLGLRVSALSLLEAAGMDLIQKTANGSAEDINRRIQHMADQIDYLPSSSEAVALETALAKAATQIAVERHVGRLEKLPTPTGTMFTQFGKDLSQVRWIIGTGGIFAHSSDPGEILREACMNPNRPDLLKPVHPAYLVDRQYILWAMGLLSSKDPVAALAIMRQELKAAD